MAGREKIEVVLYSLEGKFLEKYESMSEFRKRHYPDDVGIRPMFITSAGGFKYELVDSGIAFTERVGRDKALFVLDVMSSPYCKQTDKDDIPVEVVNLEGEVVAEFKSFRLLCKMMPHISTATIYSSLKAGKGQRKRGGIGLTFRYKQL